jgi:type IV secretion system protein TrbF
MANNPFLNIRRKYNSMFAERTMMFGFLKIVTLSCLSILLVGIGGFINLSSESKFVPYVIQKDEYGNNSGFVKLDKVPPPDDIDFVIAGKEFIQNLRMVTTDRNYQKEAMKTAFSYIAPNDNAKSKVVTFYNQTPESNPLTRSDHETVSIEDVVVLHSKELTWQVDWTEKVFSSKSGDILGKPTKKRALLQLYQSDNSTKMDKDSLMRNPHLIYVRDFDWQNVE